ncbi:glycoside hydrolase family 16 protein [Suillus plorans]|uniref:Glycoside hydrolase family 16 protein n=1 Tax=Suillus plorans TaxID=116603 RepID=A0A9P7DBQ6_9AGAM|nr:glycoside hydrolase family 16 protein [Suillus plorans]KAG1787577.1 glycoside hydrolase family 16 protein [Suillus plorans]
MASPRPFFLTPSSSDDHSSQEDSPDSPRPRISKRRQDPPPSAFTFPFADPARRSPFLSPASRPSTIWSPPPVSANPSVIALPLTQKKPIQSTRLKSKLTKDEKPWLTKKRRCESGSWWLTFVAALLGVLVAAALCFRGWQSVDLLSDSQLCLVMQDDFDSSIDPNNWSYDIELGGFGNGEFEMTTDNPSNVYISNGQLYIMPTLTSDSIDGGWDSVMSGATYPLQDCTAQGGGSGNSTTTGSSNSTTSSNSTSTSSNPCTAVSNNQSGTIINPVMSGRLNTRGKQTIKYGRVEVRAKLPQGDWLWPAIWMLPQGNSTSSSAGQGEGFYGAWPLSGEIDIMEARGNLPSYPAQGSNYVRSSLNYGPFAGGSTPISTGTSTTANLLKSIYGWVSTKRGNFADGFHVYAFEWTSEWMRFYTDDRLQAMINLKISSKSSDSYFFNTGGFPGVAMNASSGKEVVVADPWSTAYGGSAAAPFDQEFYLVIDLAVGGTSGWFPDSVGGKPWYDGSATAMRDFASKYEQWTATWPPNPDQRAFRIDYVKMWKLCR